MVKLQENPDSIPEGETPATITLMAFDNLVDVARPGDKVEVRGDVAFSVPASRTRASSHCHCLCIVELTVTLTLTLCLRL